MTQSAKLTRRGGHFLVTGAYGYDFQIFPNGEVVRAADGQKLSAVNDKVNDNKPVLEIPPTPKPGNWSYAELAELIRDNKVEAGKKLPTGEYFVNYRRNGQPLIIYGILKEMVYQLQTDAATMTEMHRQGYDTKGRVYERPDDEAGELIYQNQKNGDLPDALVASAFEDGDRSIQLSVPVGIYLARVQSLYSGNRSDDLLSSNRWSVCPARSDSPQP